MEARVRNVRFEEVNTLEELNEINACYDALSKEPLLCTGSFIKDSAALQNRHEWLFSLWVEIRGRRVVLENRASVSRAAA